MVQKALSCGYVVGLELDQQNKVISEYKAQIIGWTWF